MSKIRGLLTSPSGLSSRRRRTVHMRNAPPTLILSTSESTLYVLGDAESYPSKGGRPYYDEVLMCKTLTLSASAISVSTTHSTLFWTATVSCASSVWASKPLYTYRTYRSEPIETFYKRMGVESKIHEKGYRNKPFQKRQKNAYKKELWVMARVEHIFAFMENSMNGNYLHYRNLGRVSGGIGLMNMTYNLFQLVQLLVTGQRLSCVVPNRKRMGTTSSEKGLH